MQIFPLLKYDYKQFCMDTENSLLTFPLIFSKEINQD